MRIATEKGIELINLNHYEQADWRALAERVRKGML
jgi:hypothetical protein